MVAFLSLFSAGLTSLVLAFLFYPRLPHYTFQIRSASPRWFSEGFRAKLGAKVKLKNDNNIAIDIHALSFDLYYEDIWGETQLLGNVQDPRQRETQALQNKQIYQASKIKTHETVASIVEDAAFSSTDAPIWKLRPKKFFEAYDHVLMAPIGGIATVSNLLYDMVRNWGVVEVRSTGAIHLKANGQMPLTLNIICDNSLNAFTLEMQGIHCELDRLDIGWKDISSAMKSLQGKLLRPKSELTQQIEDQNLNTVGT